MKTKYNRRNFIKTAGVFSLGLSTPFISAFNMKAMQAAALDNISDKDDYKALVCLFLNGGNDSFNMLVPVGDVEYNEYAVTRSGLAINKEDLIPVYTDNVQGKSFGVHPSMFDIASLFNNGHLTFIVNTGSLIQPTTKEEYKNKSVPLPLGLFSHSDQQHHWQTANPGGRTSVGWAGKIADMMHGMNDNSLISMNISLSGTNVFQYGNSTSEFAIKWNNGAGSIKGYNGKKGINIGRTQGINMLFERQYSDIYEKTYMDILRSAQMGSKQFDEAVDSAPDFITEFKDDEISQSFKMIAKTIAVRETLGFKRQIFFLKFNGWDHHNDLLVNQSEMLKVVNDGLISFSEVLNQCCPK
jgi:uncharacterized protein (DUF1501 family)